MVWRVETPKVLGGGTGDAVRQAIKEFATFLEYDPSDPGDLQDFVNTLQLILGWVAYILCSIAMIVAVYKMGDGALPPEPQFWIEFRAWLFAQFGQI